MAAKEEEGWKICYKNTKIKSACDWLGGKAFYFSLDLIYPPPAFQLSVQKKIDSTSFQPLSNSLSLCHSLSARDRTTVTVHEIFFILAAAVEKEIPRFEHLSFIYLHVTGVKMGRQKLLL
jgi:hypothetical protein